MRLYRPDAFELLTETPWSEDGRGRYSLWTGDLGVALYLADCITGRGVYPVFDEFY